MIAATRSTAILSAVILIAIGALLAMTLIVPYTLSHVSEPQAPAVEFIDTDYVSGSYCPGERVAYTLHLRVNRDKSHMYVSVSYLRGLNGEGDTVIWGKVENAVATGIPTAREIIDHDPHFSVPDLPPGEYMRVITIGTLSEDSEPAMLTLPFTVRSNCGD